MNVLFINCVCSNTGDVAILEAARTVMCSAWEDPQFVVQDDHVERVRDLYPGLTVRGSCYWWLAYMDGAGWRSDFQRRRRLARFQLARRLWGAGMRAAASRLLSPAEIDYLEAYQLADVVVATGGTYLVEQYDLGQRLFDMETAVALGRPLVLYTQSLGPFRNSANRRRLRAILGRAALILVRDERSLRHLQDLNLPNDRIRVTPDAAFALADDDLGTRAPAEALISRPHPRVAISVRRWDHFTSGSPQEGMTRYRDSISALVNHLVRRLGAEVAFLSTCQGAPGYHDDSQVAAAITAALPDDVHSRVHVDGNFHTPGELIHLLRGFDCVISTRMHLAILALGVGTPILPIAYEFKTTELCSRLGYAEPPLHIDEVSPEGLIASFERFSHGCSAHARRVNEAVSGFRQQACEVADELRASVSQGMVAQSMPLSSGKISPVLSGVVSPIKASRD